MTDSTEARPYEEAALAYFDHGWRGVLPLPERGKYPPPTGRTGATGTDYTRQEIAEHVVLDGSGNIGLRMPDGVIGIDVDAYGDKVGGETLQQLEADLGALPATFCTTSRDDGVSGIRLFRVPTDTRFIPALPGIEIVQPHHRYAVVWPSVHPSGNTYVWLDSVTGEQREGLPEPGALPRLPDAWVEHLTTFSEPAVKTDANPDEVREGFPTGEPCVHIVEAARECVNATDNRHDTFNAGILSIAHSARLGCPGGSKMLDVLRADFLVKIDAPDRDAAGEYDRMVAGALRIVAATEQGEGCPDDLSWLQVSQQRAELAADLSAAEESQQWTLREQQKAALKDRARMRREVAEEMRREELGERPDMPVLTLDELLTAEYDEPRWTVESLWPAGRCLLVAAAKSGKTTLVTNNLLPALADGGYLFGRYVVPEQQRNILFMNLEVSEQAVAEWLRAAKIRNTGKIYVSPLRGLANAVEITTPEGREAFADELRARDIGTVILDPLVPMLSALGIEENDNGGIARFFSWWTEALTAGGVTNDLIVHHTGHGANGRARGASRLQDDADSIWSIMRDEDSNVRSFKAIGRDVEVPEASIVFDRDTKEMTLVDMLPDELVAEQRHADAERQILAALVGKNNGLPHDGILRAGFRGSAVDLTTGLDVLVRAGRIEIIRGDRYRLVAE